MAVIIQGLIPEGYSPNSVVDLHVGQKQQSRAINYISIEIRPREYIPMHSKFLLQGIILTRDLSNHCIEKPNYPCSPYSIKAEKPEIKLPAPDGSLKKQEFQKNIYIWFIDYVKVFDCVAHKKLWKILREMEIPDHLTCLLRNLYAGQEVRVRSGHGTTDLFQIGKGVRQGCILSPCLFNFYAEYIMRNAGLDKAQAGIKISGRNINNLRYADDTTLTAESEQLKSFLMNERGE